MARVFTTQFTFNHQAYDAIVTMISSEGRINFSIKVLDLELHDLLPGGRIWYEGREGFKKLPVSNHLTEKLIQSIVSSVEHHLVVQP